MPLEKLLPTESSSNGVLHYVRPKDFARIAKALSRQRPISERAIYTDPGPSPLNSWRPLQHASFSVLEYIGEFVPLTFNGGGESMASMYERIERRRDGLRVRLGQKTFTHDQFSAHMSTLNAFEKELRSTLKDFKGYRVFGATIRYYDPASSKSNFAAATHRDLRGEHRNTIVLTRTVYGTSTVYSNGELSAPNGSLSAHLSEGAWHRSPGGIESDYRPRLTIVIVLNSEFVTRD